MNAEATPAGALAGSGGLAGSGAIVTGAARGLGQAIAELFLASGANVLVVDRDARQLAAATTMLADTHGPARVAAVVADLADEAAADRVVEYGQHQFGTLHVLVNNAGIVKYAPFLDTSSALLRELLLIDVESVFRMTQSFARYLIAGSIQGNIINIGSSHAETGVGGTAAYAAAKGAIHALTRALAVELAPHGIRVNTAAFGTTATERVRNELPATVLEKRLRQIPLARAATPQEAAGAVLHLTTAGYMTGATLMVDGGFTVFGDS